MSATPSLKQYRDLEDAYRSVTLKLIRKEAELEQLRVQLVASLTVSHVPGLGREWEQESCPTGLWVEPADPSQSQNC